LLGQQGHFRLANYLHINVIGRGFLENDSVRS
jgi:hypothetical protein